MQAAVAPALKSRWEVKDVPPPEPGPNQVLIKLHASGLCFTDVHQTNGELPGPFPRILGHEPVGEIVALGAGVHSRKVGDRAARAADGSSCCDRELLEGSNGPMNPRGLLRTGRDDLESRDPDYVREMLPVF